MPKNAVKSNTKLLISLIVAGLGVLTLGVQTWADSPEIFPPSLLKDFLSWESVTDGEKPFISNGHGGILVRSYFNAPAGPVYKGKQDIPFLEGSILAKAVIPDEETPSKEATRVYFMRKMDANYDPNNNNWAYAYADRQANGSYKFSEQGKLEGCYTCHSAHKEYDYAFTVKIYQDLHPKMP